MASIHVQSLRTLVHHLPTQYAGWRRVSCRNYNASASDGRYPHSSHHDEDIVSSSTLPVQADLLERYRALSTLGLISYNEEQVRVVIKLKRLQKELVSYTPPGFTQRLLDSQPPKSTPWWLFSDREGEFDRTGKALVAVRGHAEELAALETPKGLLLTGPPGSGKSFLVDLWFESLPTVYKARKHYSQLVLEIYRAVWEETQRRMNARYSGPKTSDSTGRGPWNKAIRNQVQNLLAVGKFPIKWSRLSSPVSAYSDPPIAFVVAKRLLLQHWLLVFDEMQLLDVSSANLLADVLSWYWRMGGVVVGTSNKVPDELYRNGVQRDRLEPFVEALKARCPVEILDTQKDWRELIASKNCADQTWFLISQESDFRQLLFNVALAGTAPVSKNLSVFGRELQVPWATDSACKFTFADLCDQSLGPADYLTIAASFPVVVITDIPVLLLSAKNQARRFISLIDALYESRCKVICLSQTPLDKLFFPEALSEPDSRRFDIMAAEAIAETQDLYRPNISSYDVPSMKEAPVPKPAMALDALSIFSGEEERFAFKRALSRLVEMTSAAYNRKNEWSPLPQSARQWESLSSLNTQVSEEDSQILRSEVAAQHGRSGVGKQEGREPSLNSDDNSVLKRPESPRLSEDHIWGMRDDWGARAKEWGKGVKARREQKESDSGSRDR